jgi:hypothetical protein
LIEKNSGMIAAITASAARAAAWKQKRQEILKFDL